MKSRGAGTILTTCGAGAWFPVVGQTLTAYAAAKAGVCRFTDHGGRSCHGVRVNCLQPGQVWSPETLRRSRKRSGGRGPDLPRAEPLLEHAAELAAFLLSDESAPLTGRIASVDEDWWRDPQQVQAVSQSLHAYCLRRVSG